MRFKNLLIRIFTLFIFSCPALCLGTPAPAGEFLTVGDFSGSDRIGGIPSGWEPLVFKKIHRKTVYELVKQDNVSVLAAKSQAASSGLIRKIRIDPGEYPIISWQWKITKTFDKGDVRKKQGDDYPARIYITFEFDPEQAGFFEKAKYKAAKLLYGEYPPAAAINYIWASNAPKGTVVPNPYTKQAMMIVVQSGGTDINVWKTEERNILEDYQKAFGGSPPMITGVAVMTDTDNTGDSALTFYGDIFFKKRLLLNPEPMQKKGDAHELP